MVKEIAARHENGQPVLVGTISVEVSELLSERLTKRGITHTVLNAKPEHAAREADIVAEAGQPGAVTIATNMAGRGVDIKLGGNPEHLAHQQLAREGVDRRRRRGLRAAHAASCCRSSSARSQDEPRAGDGGRRAVHLRHRAPRVAAHRQPAARPLRAPGRPRRIALLPLRRGRPRAAVRGRPHLPDPRQTRRRRRGGQRGTDRGRDALQTDRESPEEGRGAELPDPQTRARVRRRDERAAPRDLRLPRRGARRQEHRRGGPPRGRERDRADDRPVHAAATSSRTGTSTACSRRSGSSSRSSSTPTTLDRTRRSTATALIERDRRGWRSSATTRASRRSARS